MKDFKFTVIKKSKKNFSRRGIIKTLHGNIETPAFIPVGTQAALKGITSDEAKSLGIQIIFVNTYHLSLRPGERIIKNIGGLHDFMNWNRPIITDSGGFQVFSLGEGLVQGVGKIASIFPEENKQNTRYKIQDTKNNQYLNFENKTQNTNKSKIKIKKEGVEFKSHIDGKKILLTPEKSVQIQKDLGADFILAFDECTSPLASYEYTKEALERTHGWEVKSLEAFRQMTSGKKQNTKKPQTPNARFQAQAIYGIVQGGAYKDLREESAKFIGKMDFFGMAIGGSLGKSKKDMHQILDWTIPLLPEEKPRHLLGIGGIEDIKEGVKRGIDTFDCAAPTRMARNGTLLMKKGRINIMNAKYKTDKAPIEKNCKCYTCQNYSRAYLRHLFWAKEMLAGRLATIHNLHFMMELMKEIRNKI
jgi:queuine tRNA-ribosyltransferase/7-cyano-7-deazaguanine tRNA-ribosyltransferase